MLSTRTPRSFPARLLSSQADPSMCWCLGLYLPRCRNLQISLLFFMSYQSTHFCSLSRSLWMGALASSISATPSLVSSQTCWGCISTRLSRALMNRTGPSTDPWLALLVTGLDLDFLPLITTLWAWPLSHITYFSAWHHIRTGCEWRFKR